MQAASDLHSPWDPVLGLLMHAAMRTFLHGCQRSHHILVLVW